MLSFAADKSTHGMAGYGAACLTTCATLVAGLGLALAAVCGVAVAGALGLAIEWRQAQLNRQRIAAGEAPRHDVDPADAVATLLGGCAYEVPLLTIYMAYVFHQWLKH